MNEKLLVDNSLPKLNLRNGEHPRFLESALKNMLDPSVKYMRNNTHNKTYGCDLEPRLESPDKNYFSTEVIDNPLKRSGRSQIVNSKQLKSPLHKTPDKKLNIDYTDPKPTRPIRSTSECRKYYT